MESFLSSRTASSLMLMPYPSRPSEAEVGMAIRERRIAFGMTQSQLAAQIGVTYQQVQNYEKGSVRIAASTLKTIADLLEVSVSEFFQIGNARREPDL